MSQTTSFADSAKRTPAATPEPGEPTPRRRRPTGLVVALVVAIAVIAALVAVIVWPDESDDVTTGSTTTEEPATTFTTAPSTTAPSTTAASTTAPPTTAAPVDTSTAVFPDAASSTRYDDPVDAARAFAVDFVGFTDPLVGEFMQGDARSGEVDVRPVADGPVTTVFVRQLGTDGSWWALGSATADITVDAPSTGDAITSPVTVSGSARAFEGVVPVEVRQDGTRSPIGTGTVMGGGDVPRPFTGQVSFPPPAANYGALVFLTNSGENGQVWAAAVMRVRFA